MSQDSDYSELDDLEEIYHNHNISTNICDNNNARIEDELKLDAIRIDGNFIEKNLEISEEDSMIAFYSKEIKERLYTLQNINRRRIQFQIPEIQILISGILQSFLNRSVNIDKDVVRAVLLNELKEMDTTKILIPFISSEFIQQHELLEFNIAFLITITTSVESSDRILKSERLKYILKSMHALALDALDIDRFDRLNEKQKSFNEQKLFLSRSIYNLARLIGEHWNINRAKEKNDKKSKSLDNKSDHIPINNFLNFFGGTTRGQQSSSRDNTISEVNYREVMDALLNLIKVSI